RAAVERDGAGAEGRVVADGEDAARQRGAARVGIRGGKRDRAGAGQRDAAATRERGGKRGVCGAGEGKRGRAGDLAGAGNPRAIDGERTEIERGAGRDG